jgi:hypothetical protein
MAKFNIWFSEGEDAPPHLVDFVIYGDGTTEEQAAEKWVRSLVVVAPEKVRSMLVSLILPRVVAKFWGRR